MNDKRAEPAEKPVPDTLPKLLGTVLAMFVMGFLILAVVDVLFSLVSDGTIGVVSGWAAALLCMFTFTEEFKRYRGTPGRIGVAGLSLLIGVAGGIAVTFVLPDTWWPLIIGATGSAVAALGYAVIWYFGINAVSRGN
ncbi:hypothetical protein [Salininema proteolyticum]|uniref:Uncharacterized protein n=1 Tax=Salininema proteolyticum TaxID=1607685 RepID=A0ABV8U3L5_9ACTN